MKNKYTLTSAISILEKNGFKVKNEIINSKGANGTNTTGACIDYLHTVHNYILQ